MLERIRRLTSLWPLRRTPRVEKPAPVVKTGLSTGNSGEEQTRYSAQKGVEAGLYGRDGRLEDNKGPNLDEPG